MDTPYIGEIKLFAGSRVPKGWAVCDGRTLAIEQNDALYRLLGTTFGGDGSTTFALPDLRGRVPIHKGNGPGLSNYRLGEAGGAEAVALTVDQLPAHAHTPRANSRPGTSETPAGNFWAATNSAQQFAAPSLAKQNMNPSLVENAGGGAFHDNMPPYLGINFIIAIEGIFPPPS